MIPTYILEWLFVGLLTGGFFGYLLWKMYKEEEKCHKSLNNCDNETFKTKRDENRNTNNNQYTKLCRWL